MSSDILASFQYFAPEQSVPLPESSPPVMLWSLTANCRSSHDNGEAACLCWNLQTAVYSTVHTSIWPVVSMASRPWWQARVASPPVPHWSSACILTHIIATCYIHPQAVRPKLVGLAALSLYLWLITIVLLCRLIVIFKLIKGCSLIYQYQKNVVRASQRLLIYIEDGLEYLYFLLKNIKLYNGCTHTHLC